MSVVENNKSSTMLSFKKPMAIRSKFEEDNYELWYPIEGSTLNNFELGNTLTFKKHPAITGVEHNLYDYGDSYGECTLRVTRTGGNIADADAIGFANNMIGQAFINEARVKFNDTTVQEYKDDTLRYETIMQYHLREKDFYERNHKDYGFYIDGGIDTNSLAGYNDNQLYHTCVAATIPSDTAALAVGAIPTTAYNVATAANIATGGTGADPTTHTEFLAAITALRTDISNTALTTNKSTIFDKKTSDSFLRESINLIRQGNGGTTYDFRFKFHLPSSIRGLGERSVQYPIDIELDTQAIQLAGDVANFGANYTVTLQNCSIWLKKISLSPPALSQYMKKLNDSGQYLMFENHRLYRNSNINHGLNTVLYNGRRPKRLFVFLYQTSKQTGGLQRMRLNANYLSGTSGLRIHEVYANLSGKQYPQLKYELTRTDKRDYFRIDDAFNRMAMTDGGVLIARNEREARGYNFAVIEISNDMSFNTDVVSGEINVEVDVGLQAHADTYSIGVIAETEHIWELKAKGLGVQQLQ